MCNKSDYYNRHRQEMMQFVPKKISKVLEIGCGKGRFRENFTLEIEYWGVEPSKEAAEIAMLNLYKVLIGTYQEVLHKIPEEYFDLIICNDVIEHMVDHEKFLRNIKSKMRNEAHLIASIPNVRYLRNLFNILIKKDWKYQDSGVLDRTHMKFFTEKSILRTFEETGFVNEKFMGMNAIRPNSFLKKCALYIVQRVLGADVKYQQFGVCEKYMKSTDDLITKQTEL